ncbi:cell wall-binding repeat-containing protein [Herbiconiux sp. P15]|uniref:cell wall-binding repeat-containing protein n=1 Tax=Herbiconiux liukaitaii TaxID=3342799 RepID=UPI0035B959B6
MNHTAARRTGRFAISALFSAALLGALVVPHSAVAAPSEAPPGVDGPEGVSAEELIPAVLCPQQSAAVGFPLSTAPLAQAGSLRVARGALPKGVRLQSGGYQVVGAPSEVGTSSFVLELTTVRPDGHTDVTTKSCTTIVRAAPAVSRVAGIDRYAQALAVSALTFGDGGADTVYLASGEKFTDALSATAVAAQHAAPLLLTGAAGLPAGVLEEIRRLGATDVVVVGGEASVSAAVAAQLKAATAARVTRIGGADRFEVSRALIGHPEFGVTRADAAFVATGANFPDALTASPAAAVSRSPVLLVDGSLASINAAESALLDELGTTSIGIVGGPASVSASFASSIERSFAVTRYAGSTRFAVGASVNGASFASASTVYLASGYAFADALSGGVAAGIGKAPLYVTPPTCLTPEVWAEVGRLAPAKVVLLGGTSTLEPSLERLSPCGLP